MSTSAQAATLIVGTGRHETDNAALLRLLEQLRRIFPEQCYAPVSLYSERFPLAANWPAATLKTVHRITLLPAMLTLTAEDEAALQRVLDQCRTLYPGARLDCGPAVGIQAGLLRAAQERIAAAEAEFGGDYQRSNAVLLVAGRGANEPAVNAVISKFSRLLEEGMGFAWAVACYSAAAVPDVAAALAQVERLGFRQAVVFPGVLFDQNRLTAIRDAVAAYRSAHPELTIAVAPSLDDGEAVAEACAVLIQEVASGAGNDNCQTCRYRERTIAVHPDGSDSARPSA